MTSLAEGDPRTTREPARADQVDDRVLQRSVEGACARNARLPSEADLSLESGVSRRVP